MQFSITEPALSPEQIGTVMSIVYNAMKVYAPLFLNFAKALFPILFALELAKEALNIAQGKEHNLVKVLLTFFMVTLLLASFQGSGGVTYEGNRFNLRFGQQFFNIPYSAITEFYKVSDAQVKEVKEYRDMITKGQGGVLKHIVDFASFLAKGNPINILSVILYYISNLLGLAVFISVFVSYGLLIFIGPIAVLTLMNSDLSFIFRSWIKGVLAHVVIFMVICLAMHTNMAFQVTAIKMAHGETNLGFWKSTKVTMYMAALAFGNFIAALKIGPILFKFGDGKSMIGKS